MRREGVKPTMHWGDAVPRCLRLSARRVPIVFRGVISAADEPDVHARCDIRVRRLLQHVALPDPWDINEFCDRLEQHRGREIDLVGVAWTAGDSTGAWQPRQSYDIIGYAANTSPVHQDHIILHEIGHMISAHRGRCVLSASHTQRLAPDLAPAAFAHLLGSTSADADEHEAETIATMILARSARRCRRDRTQREHHLDARTSAALGRVMAAFDDR